ncbi:MAG: YmdB family metallophosphoesterase, partial [Paracoccaceae bacterium]|nr:YmdB family metallophosphoesterase [Paracoccaceae bacterium]
AGMCGDYNSVIGMEPIEPIQRFVNGMVKNRFTPASGEATLSGVLLETDDASGLAKSLRPVRIGGWLYDSLL